MIKREFKVNLKSFIIWTGILVLIFLIVFSVYPFIITDDTVKNLDEMMKVFPKELLKAFNMDITSINSVYGWLKSEGFMFILLIAGVYSSILGLTIVLKEENDKTSEYLSFLPIKRTRILLNKVFVSIIYIILMIIVLGIFNYIALLISGNFDHKQYFLLSITPLFSVLPLFSINLFISTFLHKTKKTFGIALGIVFISYLFSVLSDLSSKVEFLRFFSIYTLTDTRNIISNTKIEPIYIVISLFITIVFIVGSYIRYNKKELL